LAADVAALGFDAVRMAGRRVSGAAPGKEVAITIDLGDDRP
jgi:hypothetical protein